MPLLLPLVCTVCANKSLSWCNMCKSIHQSYNLWIWDIIFRICINLGINHSLVRRCIFAQIKVHHSGDEVFTFTSLARQSCFDELQLLIKYIVEEVKDTDSLTVLRLDHETTSVSKIYKRKHKRSQCDSCWWCQHDSYWLCWPIQRMA